MHALKSLLVFSVVGHGSILNTKLLARVGLDMLVPLQTTIHGHIVVVVATNDFTKLVELHLLASKDCEVIAQFFFDCILMQHVCSHEDVF